MNKFNWGQININFQSVGAKTKGGLNKWGQININFQSKGGKPKGAERFLVLQYEEAPLGFPPFD